MSDENAATYCWEYASGDARVFLWSNICVIWNVFNPFLVVFVLLAVFEAGRSLYLDTVLSSEVLSVLPLVELIIHYYLVAFCVMSYIRLVMEGEADFIRARLLKPTESEVSFAVQFVILFIWPYVGYVFLREWLSLTNGFLAIISVIHIIILFRVPFYFMGLALNEPISLVESIRKTKGFTLKMMLSSFLATFYVFLAAIFGVVVLPFIVSGTAMSQIPFNDQILAYVIQIQISIFIMPIVMALYAYVVCHYYMLVENQNTERSVL